MAKGGPGKSYRKGISLIEAVEKFGNEEAAHEWFVERRWPDGVRCPDCDSENVKMRNTKRKTPVYHCNACKYDFTVKSGTIMHDSKLSLSKWAMAFYLFNTSLKGVSSMKLSRDLGITQKNAWHMAHRIRETWNNETDKMAGPVEADETYIGGKEANKHEWKKQKAGRGTVGKTPVAGVIDRPTNQIATKVVPATSRKVLQGFVEGHTEEGAQVYTDEHAAYKGINRPHEAVAHGASEYVRLMAHTNGMESHWALFKRGLNGVYHWVSVKHLGRYSTEFAGRHNSRPMDTITMMEQMAEGGVGKHLPYRTLVGRDRAEKWEC